MRISTFRARRAAAGEISNNPTLGARRGGFGGSPRRANEGNGNDIRPRIAHQTR